MADPWNMLMDSVSTLSIDQFHIFDIIIKCNVALGQPNDRLRLQLQMGATEE